MKNSFAIYHFVFSLFQYLYHIILFLLEPILLKIKNIVSKINELDVIFLKLRISILIIIYYDIQNVTKNKLFTLYT